MHTLPKKRRELGDPLRGTLYMSSCNVISAHASWTLDWCWEDLKDSKHHKPREPHIDRLVDYVVKGSKLESHGDLPRGSVETRFWRVR
ncbi:hypothetical protein BDW66DRAFT_134073 [Aspergillus desertorum]